MDVEPTERTIWGAVHAAWGLGPRYQTLGALTAYVRKFIDDNGVEEGAVLNHLASLIAKGLVLHVNDRFVALKRRR